MPTHAETRFSPYSPQQLYAMVMDVERYPEFLPWCKAARITKRTDDYFIGELVIRFANLTERYSSKVVGTPIPNPQSPIPTIEVTLVDGPFKHLTNHWRFEPTENGTNIHFHLEFQFKTALLDKLIGKLYTKAVEKMTDAFMKRADVLYG